MEGVSVPEEEIIVLQDEYIENVDNKSWNIPSHLIFA